MPECSHPRRTETTGPKVYDPGWFVDTYCPDCGEIFFFACEHQYEDTEKSFVLWGIDFFVTKCTKCRHTSSREKK